MAEPMNSDQMREAFLAYFEGKGHLRVASGSLIPVGDPTLLLTSAGMVQFKPYFSGETEPPNRRLTSSQKSFRTVDIDEVGDAGHLTMFEMLGNFSIGDYFKKEAIEYALECCADALGLPRERFAITVHDDDDESDELWRQAGMPPQRIYRFGDADNWWGPAGLEGPCGPCSELHYDFGPDRGCGKEDCAPNCTNPIESTGQVCMRYIELWNLVFMQFHHHLDGTRTPLPAPSVDTGMGLERLAVVLQGTPTIYETDLFYPFIKRVEDLSGKSYEAEESRYAMRVVAEHARSATFLIADGVVPGNEGRGYVLRRVVRRAIRHGRRLGLEGAFLGEVVSAVIEKMGQVYPELRNHENFILTVLKLEEDRFQQAFQNGYSILSDALKEGERLDGEVVFRLWDTYGFPMEMTAETAREHGMEVDLEGFEKEMAAQRQRARSTARFRDDRAKIRVYEGLSVGATEFLGYQELKSSSVVVGMITADQAVDEVEEGREAEVVLVQTPFYPEGGGQIGDSGQIVGSEGTIEVRDTRYVMPGLIVHFGTVAEGTLAMGDRVDAHVDPIRREDTARNHTATHLLHAALRQVLGTHVRQAGSLVAADRLRFDFTHVQAVSQDELNLAQWLVNEKIRQNATVQWAEDSYTSAIRRGALAFFGDKYDEQVRLVEIANGETFSFEVCGGTHVGRTGEVGTLYILGESSIGAGVRRIEAVSGRGAERTVLQLLENRRAMASMLQTSSTEVETRLQAVLDEASELRRKSEALESKQTLHDAEGLLDAKRQVNGVTLLAARASASSMEGLRQIGDWLRDKLDSGVVVLGAVVDERPILVAMVTADLVASGVNASEIVKGAAKAIQGGGGGRADVAQAGGRRADKLDQALGLVPGLLHPKGGRD